MKPVSIIYRLSALAAMTIALGGCVGTSQNPAFYDAPDLTYRHDLYGGRDVAGYGHGPDVGWSRDVRFGWAGPGPGPDWTPSHRRSRGSTRVIIDSAIYQSENGIAVDASKYVRKECEGARDCDLKAKNKHFGDPEIGARKRLIVTYRCGNGPQRVIAVPEKRKLDIDCE